MRTVSEAKCRVVAIVAMLAMGWCVPALAETPAAFCQRVGTDDAAKAIPEDLVPSVNAAFGTQLPARIAVDTTVFRCAGGRVMVCTAGANLPCGKANTNRTPNRGVVQWCRDNPAATFVPAVASGHDTIYEWACRGGSPRIVRQMVDVDARGFIAQFWKPLP